MRGATLAIVTLCLAVSAALSSFVNITRYSSSERALTIDPDDSLALVSKADALLMAKGGATTHNLETVRLLSLRSLEKTAVNASAIRQLAFSIESAPDGMSAKLLGLSERLSRREFGTQLGLIERAIQQGNLDKALLHYDVSLRGVPQSQDILFPILLGSFSDPQIRRALAPYIRAAPAWALNFLAYAVASSPKPSDVVALVKQVGGVPKAKGSTEIEDALLAALVARREFGVAREYYLTLSGNDPAVVSSPIVKFDQGRRGAGPLEWQLTESSTTGATALPDVGFQVFAASGESGVVASKILFASSGRYDLTADYGAANMPAGSSLYWKLRCLGAEKDEVVWQGAYIRPLANKSQSESFVVPAKCPVFALDLYILGGIGLESAEVDLKSLKLTRFGIARPPSL